MERGSRPGGREWGSDGTVAIKHRSARRRARLRLLLLHRERKMERREEEPKEFVFFKPKLHVDSDPFD